MYPLPEISAINIDSVLQPSSVNDVKGIYQLGSGVKQRNNNVVSQWSSLLLDNLQGPDTRYCSARVILT